MKKILLFALISASITISASAIHTGGYDINAKEKGAASQDDEPFKLGRNLSGWILTLNESIPGTTIEVYTILGVRLGSYRFTKFLQIPVSMQGIYLIKIVLPNGSTYLKRIVKE